MNAITTLPDLVTDTDAHLLPTQPYTEIPAENEALMAAITRLAGHINAAQYRFLKLLAALIQRDAWGDGGAIKSPAHWLNYYCGIDLGAAREKVRVAKCLAALPQIDAAFASGAISFSKVRAMTRSATAQNEDYLLEIARHGTAQHVEMLVRKHQRVQRLAPKQGRAGDSDGDVVAAQFGARELHWHYDDDGMLVIRGRLTPEDGALFIKAVDAAFERLRHAYANGATPEGTEGSEAKNVSAETSFNSPQDSAAQKRADALVLLAESTNHANNHSSSHSSTHASNPGLAPGQRHQLVIHIEKDSLTQNATPLCSIEHGPFLSPSTARRLACDAELLTVLEDGHGNVLNVGRKTRSVSPALRRALFIRDHCCRFPGCTESRFVDAHHIHHWCKGGETSIENLVLLCRRHHRLVHEQGFEIVNHGSGEFTFRHPDRRLLPEALYPQFFEEEASSTGIEKEHLAIEHQHQITGIEIDEHTAITQWQGEKMDYAMAVGALQNSNA